MNAASRSLDGFLRSRVNDALGYALVVEVGDLFSQVVVLEQHRVPWPGWPASSGRSRRKCSTGPSAAGWGWWPNR